jgi:DNA-binding NarL/FixJ family response regulator
MEEALAGRLTGPPDVALLDIGLPGMSGIAGIEPLKARYPSVLVLMITVHDDDERIFEAMCAGACGYLLKKTPPETLVESVREVMAGGAPMSPEVARRVVELFRRFQPPKRADYHLTPYELRVLGMLVDGHNYKTAAAELGLTVHAVSFHMRHVYEKLRVHSKSEAVAKALRQGLLP